MQIKYGDMRVHEIDVGDPVPGADGKRDGVLYVTWARGRFWVPAYAEEVCPGCGDDSDLAGFAVIIDGNVVEAAF